MQRGDKEKVEVFASAKANSAISNLVHQRPMVENLRNAVLGEKESVDHMLKVL